MINPLNFLIKVINSLKFSLKSRDFATNYLLPNRAISQPTTFFQIARFRYHLPFSKSGDFPKLKSRDFACFLYYTRIPYILFFFLIQNKFIVNAPYSDDWNAINGLVIRYFSAGDSFFEKLSLIIGQNNEHREGYLSIIAIIQFWIFGNINYKLFDLLGSLSILGIFFILYGYILKFKKPRWIILPIAFILFNFLY